MNLDRFYVLFCPRCQSWSVQEVRTSITKAIFRCKTERCQMSRKLKKAGEFGLSIKHFGPYTVREANYVIQEIKKQLNETDISNEFRTYHIE